MLEDDLIKMSAPTLAAIKTGSLFAYTYDCCYKLFSELAGVNEKLNKKGVYVTILNLSTEKTLIYVYRKSDLLKLLKDSLYRLFLETEGYSSTLRDAAVSDEEFIKLHLETLSKKLSCSVNFPHEIGIFLGYPLEDVKGFIENKGKNYK
ncbi:MAG: DUF3793 family protein, partial [Lachnospiraceae bacterium]|nr:DUF3793 family protein [Lachnospiraceae bacterium]